MHEQTEKAEGGLASLLLRWTGKKNTHTKTQSSRWLPLLLGNNNLARLNVAVCVCGCVYHKTSLCTRCDDLMCTNGTNVGILEFSVCVRVCVMSVPLFFLMFED